MTAWYTRTRQHVSYKRPRSRVPRRAFFLQSARLAKVARSHTARGNRRSSAGHGSPLDPWTHALTQVDAALAVLGACVTKPLAQAANATDRPAGTFTAGHFTVDPLRSLPPNRHIGVGGLVHA